MDGLGRNGLIAALCLLLSACASATPQPQTTDDQRYPVTVSFGPDANTLLLGTCPRRAPDSRDCRVEMLDVARQRSVAFVAPPGRYLHQPSLAADGKSILAVATAVDADKTGNRAATIVRFAPDKPDRAEVVVDSATELLLPSETESGLAYWTESCAGLTDRYCAHEPMVRWRGDVNPHRLSHRYGFRTVGPIFLAIDKVFATAEFPADLDFAKYDVLSKEDTNNFWQLDATFPLGRKKVPQAGLAGSVGARDGRARLFLLGDDKDGLGLFVAEGGIFRRKSEVPNAVIGGSTTGYVVDREGSSSAMVTLFNRRSEKIHTSLLLSSGGGPWKVLSLPSPARSGQINLMQR